MGDKLTDRIAEKTQPILQDLGYDLADLELVKEGANWYLRFFIEHAPPEAPVGIDDCQKASEALSAWLDEADPVPQAYFLEVSSPGIERPLKKEKDFIRFRGHRVQVNTYKPVNGEKVHVGLLGAVSDDALTLEGADGEETIDRAMIAKIHLLWAENKE